MIKKEWIWMNQLNKNKMRYTTQKQMEQYIDIIAEDGNNSVVLYQEFDWLVKAVLSDPTHAREMLIDAIKSHTK